MKKLEYIDESTFISENINFTDDHYKIAENLHSEYSKSNRCSPIMVKSDKKSLLFCINLSNRLVDRVAYENGENIYRVVIEKIS